MTNFVSVPATDKNIDSLPNDIFGLIFKELDPKSIGRVLKVCKRWHQIAANDKGIWMELLCKLALNSNLFSKVDFTNIEAKKFYEDYLKEVALKIDLIKQMPLVISRNKSSEIKLSIRFPSITKMGEQYWPDEDQLKFKKGFDALLDLSRIGVKSLELADSIAIEMAKYPKVRVGSKTISMSTSAYGLKVENARKAQNAFNQEFLKKRTCSA